MFCLHRVLGVCILIQYMYYLCYLAQSIQSYVVLLDGKVLWASPDVHTDHHLVVRIKNECFRYAKSGEKS